MKLDLEKLKQDIVTNKNIICDLEKEKTMLQSTNEYNNSVLAQYNAEKYNLELNFQSTKQDLQNDVIRMRINNDEIIKTKDQTINLLSDRLDSQKKDNENKTEKIKELNEMISSSLYELEKSKQTHSLLKGDLTNQLNIFKNKNDELMSNFNIYKTETDENKKMSIQINMELEDKINKLNNDFI